MAQEPPSPRYQAGTAIGYEYYFTPRLHACIHIHKCIHIYIPTYIATYLHTWTRRPLRTCPPPRYQVGTAIGYEYGALMAEHVGWGWVYLHTYLPKYIFTPTRAMAQEPPPPVSGWHGDRL